VGTQHLKVERAAARDVRLIWEDLGPGATSYNVYFAYAQYRTDVEYMRDFYYGHVPFLYWEDGAFRPTCHIQGELGPDDRRRYVAERVICGQASCTNNLIYFLVGASNAEGEGPLGYDSVGRERAPERRVCLADQ
jgi:hypothetical protein